MLQRTVRDGFFWLMVLCLFVLTGCFPFEEEEPAELPDSEDASVVAPDIEINENYYQGVVPYEPSQTRGRLYSSVNHRLDADHVELGLLEIAQDYFPVDNHLFREGQLIASSDLDEWLQTKSEDHPDGLNPEDAPGRVLVHILEHNYMDEQGESLAGIVIGLSLASTYEEIINEETEETQTMYFGEEELRIYGQAMADQLVQRLRSNPEAEQIPIIVALYQLEQQNELAPGNFLSVGEAIEGSTEITNWKTINEFFLVFPSGPLEEFDPELSHAFSQLRGEVREYFPHNLGLVGTGRFLEGQLVELTLEATAEFASKTEVIQLTQFLGGKAVEIFPEEVHLNLYVQTVQQPQSVFVRKIREEPMMHIYR